MTVIKQAQGKIRPVGSAHSFSALVPTDGTLLSLSYFNGLLNHDAKTLQAEFAAGTPMSRMGQPLKDIGQALHNLNGLNASIASATLQQAHVVEDINQNVTQAAGLSHSTALAAEQSSVASAHLRGLSEQLDGLLRQEAHHD